jgi:acetylornithine deacetylase/succinyl-diaminopimelate desuccinylase-like protein
MDEVTEGPRLGPVAAAIGDPEGLRLLTAMVAIAPSNLEDPVHDRYEKPNYRRAADELVRTARAFGLATRQFDPVIDLPPDPIYRGIPRPNVIVDLDVGAKERVLILAHYDVVPVPAEQLSHWKSPPHSLTSRPDGRLYGRGSNDDLGSGVVASLLAMKRLAAKGDSPRNVRLLLCCDEETGGLGGIEALERHDAGRAPDDPERFISGEVALIPDGSPHATSSSSGLVFLDGSFLAPVTLGEVVAFGNELVALHELAKGWRSSYASPVWPNHGAPEPVLTGRATVTRFDLGDVEARPDEVALTDAHAENDAANQIAQAVTLVFAGPAKLLAALPPYLASKLPDPFRLAAPAPSTALTVPAGALSVQVIGQSAHGGYPHRGHNPVPASLGLIAASVRDGRVSARALGKATFSVDLRLIPEMTIEPVRTQLLSRIEAWIAARGIPARIAAPIERGRGGYSVPADHPAVRKLELLTRTILGEGGVFGEYGGTDASSLAGARTPRGDRMPALVFGSMDRAAHIHEAEESVDPRLIAGVSAVIERFIAEP